MSCVSLLTIPPILFRVEAACVALSPLSTFTSDYFNPSGFIRIFQTQISPPKDTARLLDVINKYSPEEKKVCMSEGHTQTCRDKRDGQDGGF